MAFYDFINIGLPTFVPDSPMYLLNTGTNLQSDWVASLWQPPAEVYPYDYRLCLIQGRANAGCVQKAGVKQASWLLLTPAF